MSETNLVTRIDVGKDRGEDVGVEVISLPGVCDLGLNNTALEECAVYQIKYNNGEGLPRPSGVRMVIVRGEDQIRGQIEKAINITSSGVPIQVDDIRRALVDDDNTRTATAQVICVERVGGSDGRTRVSVLHGGPTDLTELYTEVNGSKVCYNEKLNLGVGIGWKVLDTEQGRRITSVLFGAGQEFSDVLTGGETVAIEGNRKLGWPAETTIDGKFPLLAQLAMKDGNKTPLPETPTDHIKGVIRKMSQLSPEKFPIIVIRENNQANISPSN